MSTSARKDRLSPPLMYAFRVANREKDAKTRIDQREHGERVIAVRRVSRRTPISEKDLRTEVAYDLSSLMNTVAFESTEDLTGFAHVQRSILNYGFPDIAHMSIDETSVDDLGDEICSVLMRYEPRLDPGSIRSARDMSARPEELKLRFLVQADLRCEPLNIPVEFVADVDFDGRSIQINRL